MVFDLLLKTWQFTLSGMYAVDASLPIDFHELPWVPYGPATDVVHAPLQRRQPCSSPAGFNNETAATSDEELEVSLRSDRCHFAKVSVTRDVSSSIPRGYLPNSGIIIPLMRHSYH